MRFSDKPHDAFVALGSNLGDRLDYLQRALEEIHSFPYTRVVAVSKAYTTRPAFYEDQPDFLNAACALETFIPPEILLGALLATETSLGRVREIPNGPRTIDLDLLFYDDLITSIPENYPFPPVVIPHPDLQNRDFVLIPLNEIARGFIHPGLQKSIAELTSSFKKVNAFPIFPLKFPKIDLKT